MFWWHPSSDIHTKVGSAGHAYFVVCTSAVAYTVAAIAIPPVHAGASIQARLGGTDAHVNTAGGPRPPRGTVTREGFDARKLNVRANPTVQAWCRTAKLCRMSNK